MTENYYSTKTLKLTRDLNKYLGSVKRQLIARYGFSKALVITNSARGHYPEIIPRIPYVDTPMYDKLLLLSSRMMALKKGMKDEHIGVEEFVRFSMESLRTSMNRIPGVIRKLSGKMFLSKLVRGNLEKVAESVTKNGWPTTLINGGKQDDFEMTICTRDCMMVRFMCSIGEKDMIPYCSFSDFINAESMGYGLRQTSTYESGVCTFCFNKKGEVSWPEALQKIQN